MLTGENNIFIITFFVQLQSAITCLKLTIKTLGQSMKYIQR